MSDITPEQSAEWAIRHATPGARVTIDCPSSDRAIAVLCRLQLSHAYACDATETQRHHYKLTFANSATIRINGPDPA